jgi:toxin-antitoxin system PIN domain toxin
MTRLLDGNVLVALVLDSHVHHRRARRWFDRSRFPFATTLLTEGTLLRVHLQLALDSSADAAWATLARLHAHPRHTFWEDRLPWSEIPHRGLQGAKQVTDARLAEIARRHQSRVATFDAAFHALQPGATELIPEA